MTAPLEVRQFIDGEWAVGGSDIADEIIDPATDETLGRARRASDDDVDRAVAAAQAAAGSWAQRTPAERSRTLLRWADAIEGDAEQLTALETRDTGKPVTSFREDELPAIVDSIRFFAGAARDVSVPASGEYADGLTSSMRMEAAGVAAGIAPWNYPLMMAAWKIAPALAAGCPVILKPAESTPLSASRLVELATELFPAGVIGLVLGAGDVGSGLVSHPGVDVVSFTGSTAAGRQVAAAAAPRVKAAHLELGGKAPAIVFADADLEATAVQVATAGFYNAGQDCMAAARVLVQASVHDRFVELLVDEARTWVPGDPQLRETRLGPLTSRAHRDRVTGFLHRLPEHAERLVGGEASERGAYLTPAVVAGLRQDDEAVQEEIFGPVLGVQSFTDEADAIAMANGTDYGLVASVWTADHSRAIRLTRALRFGGIWINDHLPIVSEMPHGGFKQSGYGRDLSRWALDHYLVPKHVMARV